MAQSRPVRDKAPKPRLRLRPGLWHCTSITGGLTANFKVEYEVMFVLSVRFERTPTVFIEIIPPYYALARRPRFFSPIFATEHGFSSTCTYVNGVYDKYL